MFEFEREMFSLLSFQKPEKQVYTKPFRDRSVECSWTENLFDGKNLKLHCLCINSITDIFGGIFKKNHYSIPK